MFRLSASRLGGCNAFMMLMRQCSGRHPTFVGLSGPVRARKLSKVYHRLNPKRFELLKARAVRAGSLTVRKNKQKPNVTARFVSKNFAKVEGDPTVRFASIAKMWRQSKKASA